MLRIAVLKLALVGMLAWRFAEQPCAAAHSNDDSHSTIRLVAENAAAKPAVPNASQVPAENNLPIEQLPKLFSTGIPRPGQELEGAEDDEQLVHGPPGSLDAYSPAGATEEPPPESESDFGPAKWFGLHQYSTNGRNVGMGVPLVGTSWLNRPYYAGVELGPVWICDPPQADISRDIDLLGGVYIGDDWDYYWGTELAVERATPELINSQKPHVDRGDRMLIWTANMLYYPWGDSLYRPYWRCGIGAMEIDYPMDDGHRRDEALWAFPVGLGIKYPFRRWIALRAEIGDTIGLGNSGVATQHDWALSFAVEWRFGAHPNSYWPWNPSRHIW